MDAARGIALSAARECDEIVFRVRGQVDFATSGELAESVRSFATDSCAAYALDFELVTFIDSEAFKTLIALRRDLADRGKTLYISRCSSQVHRILSLLGIDRYFKWNGDTPTR